MKPYIKLDREFRLGAVKLPGTFHCAWCDRRFKTSLDAAKHEAAKHRQKLEDFTGAILFGERRQD